jgi:thiol:disulfide interchange protein
MERTSQRALPLVLIAVALALIAARVVSHSMKPDSVKSAGPTNEAAELVRWVSPEEGQRLAAASKKPILYDFTAEWCGPCHMLDGEVFQDPAMAREINARFIAVRVTDRMQEEGRNPPLVAELQRRYEVRGFPTVIFADAAGRELGRMQGYGGRDGFARAMESAR